VNTNMERALRRISVERGLRHARVRAAAVWRRGGLHAVDLARALACPRLSRPLRRARSRHRRVTADVIKDQSRTVMMAVKTGVKGNLAEYLQSWSARRVLRASRRLCRCCATSPALAGYALPGPVIRAGNRANEGKHRRGFSSRTSVSLRLCQEAITVEIVSGECDRLAWLRS